MGDISKIRLPSESVEHNIKAQSLVEAIVIPSTATAYTQSSGTSDTTVATTAFVAEAVSKIPSGGAQFTYLSDSTSSFSTEYAFVELSE